MAGPYDLTGQNIENTYQRVVQTPDGINYYDGTGSLLPLSSSFISGASAIGSTITFTRGDGSTFPVTVAAGTGAPGGSNTNIQFNSASVFSGSSNFSFDYVNNNLTLTGSLNITGSTTQIGNNTLLGNTLLSGSIIISGAYGTNNPTVRIYGDTEHNGYIRFDPVSTNIDPTISASYIYVSGSTNDLYFTQNGQGYGNTTRLRWLEGNLYTGLLNGGLITSASSTTFNISSGSGIIVNLNASINDNPYPTVQYVNWGNLTNQTLTYRTTNIQTFIGIDSSGNIIQQTDPWIDGQYNTSISLGTVLHQNLSTINGSISYPNVAYGWKQRSYDFIKAFGPLKIAGYAISTSSSLGLTVGSGTAFADGRNYQVDPNNPSYITDNGTNVSKIFRYYQSGSSFIQNTNAGAGFTVIDPANYNPGNSGSLTPVPGGQYTVQRIFWYPNSVTKAIVVYYGNTTYNSISNARDNYIYENFNEVENTKQNAIYLGAIIIKSNGSFTTAADYQIIAGGLFRSITGGGGGGGSGTTSLASLSDVSLSSLTYGDLLMYNASTNLWNNTHTLSGSYTLTGSLTTNDGVSVQTLTASFVSASGGITGSLFGTSSWAQSASQALTSSYTPNALVTASVSSNTITFTKGNGSTFPITINTGSGTIPGGSDTYIQYNSGSKFAGSQYFRYIYQSSSLQLGLANARGIYSVAHGENALAAGALSHAEGYATTATGSYSHAEGASAVALGYAAHAEGYYTQANGDYSHAEGYTTIASGNSSHTEGINTVTISPYSHAEGYASITNSTTDTAISSSITLYAYNTSSGLLITDPSYPPTSNQADYILWADNDNQKIYLSILNNIFTSNPDGSGNCSIFYISNYDSQGPSINVTNGGDVFRLDDATGTWGGAVNAKYSIGFFDYDNFLIEVYDTDLTSIPTFAGVVATLPSYGTYVFKVDSISYSSNTSSITLDSITPQQEIRNYNNAGSPSLTGVTLTSGHIFLTNISNTWGGYEEGPLITSTISTTQQYDFLSKTFKTAVNTYPVGSFIRAYYGGSSFITTIVGTNIGIGGTYVTTSAQLGPIFNDTLILQKGEAAHAGGLFTETYGSFQTAVGVYNTLNNYTDVFVVGGGTDSVNRKDILAISTTTITMSGSVNISGSLSVNGATVPSVNSGIITLDFGSAPGTNITTASIYNSNVDSNSVINIYIMNTSSIDHSDADHQILSLYGKVLPGNIIDNTSFVATCITDLRLTGTFKAKYSIIN